MGIPFDHLRALPPSQLLDRKEINPVLNQPGGKCVSQVMKPELLNLRVSYSNLEGSDQITAVDSRKIFRIENMICLI
jgi:hypothetical protein